MLPSTPPLLVRININTNTDSMTPIFTYFTFHMSVTRTYTKHTDVFFQTIVAEFVTHRVHHNCFDMFVMTNCFR